MKYWLFDGEDVTGPFAPYEIAERTDFSPATLVCPETDSEKEDAWKPVSFFEDFSEENIRAARAAAQGTTVAESEEKILVQEEQTPSKIEETFSVPISQISPEEEPLFVVKKQETPSAAEPTTPEPQTEKSFQIPAKEQEEQPVSVQSETRKIPPAEAVEENSTPVVKNTEEIPAPVAKISETEQVFTPEEEVSLPEQSSADTAESETVSEDVTQILIPEETEDEPAQTSAYEETPADEPEETVSTFTIEESEESEEGVPIPTIITHDSEQPAESEGTNTQTPAPQEPARPKRSIFRKILLVALVILFFLIAGCVVAVYQATKDIKSTPLPPKIAASEPKTETAPQEKIPSVPVSQEPIKQPATKPTVAPAPSAEVLSNIPVPPPPKQVILSLQDRAINIVKNYELSNHRGTIEDYLNKAYGHQFSQGYTGSWSAELLHKNTYIVKYRLTKTRVEPTIYVFQVDTQHEKLTGALNNITLDLIGKI